MDIPHDTCIGCGAWIERGLFEKLCNKCCKILDSKAKRVTKKIYKGTYKGKPFERILLINEY